MTPLLRASLALALAVPCLARADTTADLQALRQELANLRASYEARIQALEARLQSAQAATPTPTPTPASAPAPAPALAPTPAPAAALATAGPTVAAGTRGFNPALSLNLSGLYTRTSRDPAGYRIRGFQLPADAEVGPGARGFSLGESELGISASIDPWFSGAAHIALHPDDAVSVEEAYVQTTALGRGLTAKAGRFLSGIGYLNSQHAHSWDFVDAPLAYQALLGTQYADDGLQLTWLAPTDQFFQLRGEIGRGAGFPAGDSTGNGAGSLALAAHTGGDVGDSHSWRAGVSLLRARAAGQELAAVDRSGADVSNGFTGSTRVWLADFVWKWAPGGNATRTSFQLQGEYLRSTRDGSLTYDLAGAATPGGYRAVQSGGYLQAVYQFMPRWRLGVRTERLDGGSPDYGANAAALATSEGKAGKNSVMLDFSPSEFSRLRLQLARDRSRPGAPDHQLWLQYQMNLGAHGAHGF